MKAVEFVKQVGWVDSSKVMVDWGNFTQIEKPTHFDSDLNIFIHKNDFTHLDESDVCILELKTLVEAKELVDLYGGLFDAKKCLLLAPYAIDEDGSVDMLREAIKLVEGLENA